MILRLLLSALVSAAVPAALAQEQPPAEGTVKRERIPVTHARAHDGVSVAVQYLNLVDSSLSRLPMNVLRGRFAPGQTLALLVAKPIGSVDLPLGRYLLGGFELEAEAQLLKHFGVEDHLEATLSLVLRSGEIRLGRHASLNLAIANGLSYAFADPKWKRRPDSTVAGGAPRLLYHIGLEAELSSPAFPGFSTFARVHHRSEAYGLFGPDTTTNRIGGGLRYRFK